MNDPRPEMLRRCLEGIQMHAAGMQASAVMALQILGEMQSGGVQQQARPQQKPRGEPVHYGDPTEEMEERFTALERAEASPPNPANGGEIHPQ
jgi:hypothetical protein